MEMQSYKLCHYIQLKNLIFFVVWAFFTNFGIVTKYLKT